MPSKTKALTVGLIGENPNDSRALTALLGQRYAGKFAPVPLAKNRTGDQLANPKMLRVLAEEYRLKQPRLVVYIRDLDALASNAAKVREREIEFEKIKNVVGKDALFLLHIYQFEALILADIATFNRLYQVAIAAKGNPTAVENPKKKLVSATDKLKAPRQYHPNHSAEIAAQLNYAELLQNCAYFRAFDAAFAARLAAR